MSYTMRRTIRRIFWFAVGLVFLFMTVMAVFSYLRDRNFVGQASVATGTITDMFNRPNPNGDTEPLWYIAYEFPLADGSIFSGEKEISYNEFSQFYTVGDQIAVHYDAPNPNQHFVDVERDFRNRLRTLVVIFVISIAGLSFGAVDLLWKRR